MWSFQRLLRWPRSSPNGLRTDEVELGDWILNLAEVYDALAEARSFKPEWPILEIGGCFRPQTDKRFTPTSLT